MAGLTDVQRQIVTPFVGVWIETAKLFFKSFAFWVTPFVGVWIETKTAEYLYNKEVVTPFVGVWIETGKTSEQSD